MPTIRPAEHADLPDVANLLRTRMRGWYGNEQMLAATTIDHPWAAEDLPSLVAVDEDDTILGFVGVQVRRMRFGGREIRGVCATQLAVAPGRDAGAAGALLMSRVLSRSQELTWSDGATDDVVRMWRTFGRGGDGGPDYVRACEWLLVLRPLRWLRGTVAATLGRNLSRRQLPVGGIPFQAVGRRLAPHVFPKLAEGVSGSDATIEEIVASEEAITKGFEVRVDHDAAYLDHVFGLVEGFSGPVRRRLVRHGERPIGWYAYIPGPAGVSRVLHLAATEKHAESVLCELLEHARESGSSTLAGRAEPHLMGPLTRRLALLGYARQPVIHSKDPGLALAMKGSGSLLTRLDGEVFMN